MAHRAALFIPSSGTLAVHTFLVIDLDGTNGNSKRNDLVIRLNGHGGTPATGACAQPREGSFGLEHI